MSLLVFFRGDRGVNGTGYRGSVCILGIGRLGLGERGRTGQRGRNRNRRCGLNDLFHRATDVNLKLKPSV